MTFTLEMPGAVARFWVWHTPGLYELTLQSHPILRLIVELSTGRVVIVRTHG